ncbi:MAG: MFS transporter [Oligoflexales bacterium]|nr:MFS transporter [Oligoflexales bacterium]
MNQTEQIKIEEKQENPFASLIFNIVIPALILFYGSKPEYLGAERGFLFALIFPLGYGIYDIFRSRKFNFLSALGVVNVLLTGGIGLLKMDNFWLAVKEAAVPGMIGLLIIGSLKTPFPLVRKFLYNDKIIDTGKVSQALREKGNEASFDKLLVHSTYLLSCSFFVSALLNFILAKVIMVSQPGSEAWDKELAKMWSLSWPVIVVPSMIIMMLSLWYLLRGIKRLTGLPLEVVFKGGDDRKKGRYSIPDK